MLIVNYVYYLKGGYNLKIGMELFIRMHNFKQLRIAGKLNTLPSNGHMILGMIIANEKKQGTACISCTDLAKHMSVSTAAVSRSLKHLREAGLVETNIDSNDRRGAIISITELGRKTMYDDCKRLEEVMQKATANIPKEQLENFFSTFDMIYNGISNELNKLN